MSDDSIMEFKGSDLLVVELKRNGVGWISTLCGNGLDPFYVACKKAGLRVVDTHNEQAAAYMADACARLTGKVGVCAVSSGVAHSNALTGIVNAYFDGAPVLLITGASRGYRSGKGVFQELDQPGLASPVCKLARAVDRIDDLQFAVRQAFATALSGRYGPVHLTIPVHIMEGTVDIALQKESGLQDLSVTPPALPSMDLVKKAVELIGGSQRPLLVAGTGVYYAHAQEAMIKFSEVTGIPIVTPIWDRGSVDRPHPNFMGVIGAASGEPRLLADADLIIMAGARVDYRVGFLSSPAIQADARIIRIDSDPSQLMQGVESNLALLASLPEGFKQITEHYEHTGGNPHTKWLQEARERSRRFRSRWIEESVADTPITGRHIVDAIRPLLNEDVVFLIDGGNIGQWAHIALANDRYPGNWLTCGASAVVGWGIPGAMAARLVFPSKRILLLSGDGSFGFTITELEAALRQELPFVAVVANDKSWGIVTVGQRRFCGEEGVIASTTSEIRFDRVAEAFGVNGVRVEDPKELGRVILEGFSSTRPTIINVPICVAAPFAWD